MSKEKYEKAKKLYELSKEYILYADDVSDYLNYAETQEEKDFYVKVTDLFLQTKQKELIDKGVY